MNDALPDSRCISRLNLVGPPIGESPETFLPNMWLLSEPAVFLFCFILRSLSRRSIRSSCAQPFVEFSLLAKVGIKVPPDPTHLSGVACRESVGVGSCDAVDHPRFVEDSRFLWAPCSLAQRHTRGNVPVAGKRHQSGNTDHRALQLELTPEFFCDSFRLVCWESVCA